MISSKHRAFALIEILVVTAIIALLSAILLPVFGRARENARRSACQSQLKQIGLGLMQYAQDFDETFPIHNFVDGQQPQGAMYFSYPTNPYWRANWMSGVYPYVKNWQLFACPSIQLPNTGTEAYTGLGLSLAPNPAYPTSVTTYGVNGVAMARKLAVIPNASLIVWAQEFDTRFCAAFVRPCKDGNRYRDWHRAFLNRAHFEGGNLLFCDGHLKWRKQERVCAEDFGLNGSTVTGGVSCGPNAVGAYADPRF